MTEENKVTDEKPWCCQIDCKADATWDVHSEPYGYEDTTQACDSHFLQMCQFGDGLEKRCQNLKTGQWVDLKFHPEPAAQPAAQTGAP